MSELKALFAAIDDLMDGAPADLGQIERTLTDGYAHALSLEAEKWRLERRISEVAQTLQDGDTSEKAQELLSLARRLDGNAGELSQLRSLLSGLRRRADDLRPPAA